ncbi:MAG: hypothetical protein ABI623_00565 [bacterium]
MDFLLWTTVSLHLFSVVVWFGGLLYQAVVTFPVAKVEQKEFDPFVLHLVKRFQPFVWMCVWTILITGVVLMLFNPRFVFFEYRDRWSVILGLKQLVFGLMVFFSFGYARMFRVLETAAQNGESEKIRPYYNQMLLFGKINVGLAIIVLLLAAALNS